jgi:hypothetical protein
MTRPVKGWGSFLHNHVSHINPDPQCHVGLAGDRLAPRVFHVSLQDASVHTELRSSGEYLREGACINRKGQTKLAEEFGSM